MALISGGRINIWNVVKKQFEVVHPETETARITDFADGIVQKLALTSTMTAVTALQTDSWFGKLLKMVLTASGVRYNIAQNGYVCFGSFFGGLIIQWGVNRYGIVTLPVSCQSINRIVSAHSGINFMDAKVRETNPLIKFTLDVGGNTGDYEDAQWVNALASDANVGHDFTLPLSCSVYAYSVCHKGTSPGAVGIENGKAYDVGWTNAPVWIIAIGSM